MENDRLLREYVETVKRRRELERELAALEIREHELGEAVSDLFLATGRRNYRVNGHTVYLGRKVWMQPLASEREIFAALRAAGLGQHVRETIVNGKTLTRYIDQHGLAGQLEDTLRICEKWQVRVRRLSTHGSSRDNDGSSDG